MLFDKYKCNVKKTQQNMEDMNIANHEKNIGCKFYLYLKIVKKTSNFYYLDEIFD